MKHALRNAQNVCARKKVGNSAQGVLGPQIQDGDFIVVISTPSRRLLPCVTLGLT